MRIGSPAVTPSLHNGRVGKVNARLSDTWDEPAELVPGLRQDEQDTQDQQTEARPARALDPRLLRTVFLDLVGRPPYPGEREEWSGKGLHQLLDSVLGGPEFWNHWFDDQLYYFLLIDNFRPANESAQEVPQKLAEGRLHVRDALHRIALSPTFDQRNPGADTFVTVVMEQICGIRVQNNTRELEIGKRVYDGSKGLFLGSHGDTQSDIVRIAIEHKKAARHFLQREFDRIVRSAPPKKDMGGWVRRLNRDPASYPGILREWMLSEGYNKRLDTPVLKSNRLFVRALFVDLLGRLPNDKEVEPMRNALDGLSDSRPLRSVLVRLLLDSGSVPLAKKAEIEDPTAWISGLFQRLLGRNATPEELKEFVTVFHMPECRPETILVALLSHAEYHKY
jgi:hypothetical protein